MSTINISTELRSALLAMGETAIAVEMNNLPSFVVKVQRTDLVGMILRARAHNASLMTLDYAASLAEMQRDTAV